MTNNNWIEEFWEKVKFYNLSLDNENYDDLMEFTKFFITKKDQEHKAELESIKGEIENSIAEPTELEDVRIYNIALKDTISILDSHINKLSTE